MTRSWRVNINEYLWDQEWYEAVCHINPEERRLAQSKGRARMRICPAKGDNVVFVVKGVIRMKGVVESDGFLEGTDHQRSPYNMGATRLHAEHPEFAWIYITDVGLSQRIRKTGQRTWVQFNSSMLL